MKATSLSLCLVLALGAAGARPAEQPAGDKDLSEGIRQIEEGDYEKGIATLERVVQRLKGTKTRTRELVHAYLHQGIAHVALDQEPAAKERFRQALTVDRTLNLADYRFSPKVVAVFDATRREMGIRAPKEEKSSKLPLILIGVGAAAGGAVAIAAGGSKPQPNVGSRITFLGSTPPAGSTISLSRDRVTMTFSVNMSQNLSGASLLVGIPARTGSCLVGVGSPSPPSVGPLSLTAGQTQTVTYTFSPSTARWTCPLPMAVSTIQPFVLGPEGENLGAGLGFSYVADPISASYTFVQ